MILRTRCAVQRDKLCHLNVNVAWGTTAKFLFLVKQQTTTTTTTRDYKNNCQKLQNKNLPPFWLTIPVSLPICNKDVLWRGLTNTWLQSISKQTECERKIFDFDGKSGKQSARKILCKEAKISFTIILCFVNITHGGEFLNLRHMSPWATSISGVGFPQKDWVYKIWFFGWCIVLGEEVTIKRL